MRLKDRRMYIRRSPSGFVGLSYINWMGNCWAGVRDQFPALRTWRYLNTATFGPIPRCATDAVRAHFDQRDQTASLDFLDWYDQLDAIRGKAALWIGAQSEDIAFIPSAGVGLSWILQGLDWHPGDRILSLEDEFPNNLYAPGAMARRGVVFDVAPTGASFDADDFVGRIGERTRLVMISAINYASGFRPPLGLIGGACRRVGARFLVDGTQGVGAIPFDVASAQADFVLVHAYKWLCTPPGAGFLYVRPEARKALEATVYSWRSHRDWRRVDRLHHGAPELPEDASRYEGGGQNFPGILAMGAVLDLMLESGKDAVLDRVAALAAAARRTLADAGADVPGERDPRFNSPVVTARFPAVDPVRLAAYLRERRIAVAARHGYLRVSPHFFNDEEDLAALGEGVRQFAASHAQ